uniref:Uncharacterized protein n=1 Tax=Panagrolaimus superbus TaxID=310955 RepID=A0A914Z624_9BILA
MYVFNNIGSVSQQPGLAIQKENDIQGGNVEEQPTDINNLIKLGLKDGAKLDGKCGTKESRELLRAIQEENLQKRKAPELEEEFQLMDKLKKYFVIDRSITALFEAYCEQKQLKTTSTHALREFLLEKCLLVVT